MLYCSGIQLFKLNFHTMKNYVFLIFIMLLNYSYGQTELIQDLDHKQINKAVAKVKADILFKSISSKDIDKLKATSIENISENEKEALLINYDESALDYVVPKDGTTYIILSSTQASYQDCYRCPSKYRNGCNAKYIVEGREYTEWKNGEVTRVWTNSVSRFMGCGVWNY